MYAGNVAQWTVISIALLANTMSFACESEQYDSHEDVSESQASQSIERDDAGRQSTTRDKDDHRHRVRAYDEIEHQAARNALLNAASSIGSELTDAQCRAFAIPGFTHSRDDWARALVRNADGTTLSPDAERMLSEAESTQRRNALARLEGLERVVIDGGARNGATIEEWASLRAWLTFDTHWKNREAEKGAVRYSVTVDTIDPTAGPNERSKPGYWVRYRPAYSTREEPSERFPSISTVTTQSLGAGFWYIWTEGSEPDQEIRITVDSQSVKRYDLEIPRARHGRP